MPPAGSRRAPFGGSSLPSSDELLLPAPHGRQLPTLVFRMIMAERVKDAMNHKSGNLLASAAVPLGGVAARDRRADIKIRDHGIGALDPRELKGDDVSRPGMAEMPLVQSRNRARVDERDGD